MLTKPRGNDQPQRLRRRPLLWSGRVLEPRQTRAGCRSVETSSDSLAAPIHATGHSRRRYTARGTRSCFCLGGAARRREARAAPRASWRQRRCSSSQRWRARSRRRRALCIGCDEFGRAGFCLSSKAVMSPPSADTSVSMSKDRLGGSRRLVGRVMTAGRVERRFRSDRLELARVARVAAGAGARLVRCWLTPVRLLAL
jgi:hypothetical protein